MDAPEVRRYVGTFHKSGTALFETILLSAQKAGVLTAWLLHEGPAPEHWDVAFDYQTKTLLPTLDPDPARARYAICLRDPRDIVVSAAYYHANADEEWLHKPDADLGGMSYHDKINALQTMADRFLFEMEHTSYWQIQSMLQVPQDAPSVLITRLETLVQDFDLWEFHRIFAFLQFAPEVMLELMKFAYANSLFSGKLKPTVHRRSGKPAQYLTEFDDRTLARFEDIFGDAAVKLGYPA
jgi:hypothetical protein